MTVARKLLYIMLLRAAPQDLPYSQRLMVRILLLYLLSDMLAASATIESDFVLAMVLLSLAIVLIFTYAVLYLLNHQPRFVQTVTAIVGTGIIFNLLSWPLYMQMSADVALETTSAIVLVLILLMMSWGVLVTAHIYKNALETSMTHAILLSFSLLFISITLSKLIFPER